MSESESDPEVKKLVDEAKRIRSLGRATHITTEKENEDSDPIIGEWKLQGEVRDENGKVIKRLYDPGASDGRLIEKKVDAEGNESIGFTVTYPDDQKS